MNIVERNIFDAHPWPWCVQASVQNPATVDFFTRRFKTLGPRWSQFLTHHTMITRWSHDDHRSNLDQRQLEPLAQAFSFKWSLSLSALSVCLVVLWTEALVPIWHTTWMARMLVREKPSLRSRRKDHSRRANCLKYSWSILEVPKDSH